MRSLPKEFPQLRSESEAKSTQPTQSAHPLWSSKMLASVTPERFRAHLQCHPEGRKHNYAANPTPRARRQPMDPLHTHTLEQLNADQRHQRRFHAHLQSADPFRGRGV